MDPQKTGKNSQSRKGGTFDLRIFIILGKLKSLLYGNFVPENQKSREIVIFDKSDTSDPHETTSSKTFPSEPENLTLARNNRIGKYNLLPPELHKTLLEQIGGLAKGCSDYHDP